MSDQNAPPPGSPPPGGTPPGGTPPTEWTAGLNEDLRGYVQTKGFKDPGSVVDSYRNMEKLLGVKEKLLKLPDKDDDAQGWGEIYNKLGRPEKADEYKIEVPKDFGDENFTKWYKETAHELGLSRKQAETLSAKWNEFVGKGHKEFSDAEAHKAQADAEALQKKWGQAHAQNLNIAKQAANAFGVKPEVIDKIEKDIGYTGVMELFHAIGSKMGEGTFVSGDGGGKNFSGLLSPEAAKSRVKSLMSDSDFSRRYLAGETAAVQEMDRLHKMMAT